MNLDEREFDFVRRQLRTAMQPWREHELKADLWPRMLRRLEQAPAGFGWFESVLAGLIVAGFVAFPELIPAMLYLL